jgi:hypothetical protein
MSKQRHRGNECNSRSGTSLSEALPVSPTNSAGSLWCRHASTREKSRRMPGVHAIASARVLASVASCALARASAAADAVVALEASVAAVVAAAAAASSNRALRASSSAAA